MFTQRMVLNSAARRTRSTSLTNGPRNPLVPEVLKKDFKADYLSDSSTYPLIAIMTAAGFLVVGMSSNAVLRYKGFKVRPKHKNSMMSKESHDAYQSITEYITRRPVGFYTGAMKSLRSEGMGIDHAKWKKAKEEYDGVKRD